MAKVTMQVIADQLGLSRFAVSRALNGGDGVSAETRRKIQETAARLGYLAPVAQRGGDLFRTRNILFMVEQRRFMDRHFWPKVIEGVETATRQHNLNLMFVTISEEQEKNGTLPPSLLENKVDGVLAVGEFLPSYITVLREQKRPVILIDMDGTEFALDAVMTSDNGGAYLAVKHLADLGHIRIGFVGDLAFASSFRRRFYGFMQARHELELENNEAYNILVPAPSCYWDKAEIKAQQTALAEMKHLPTAFFCANDRVAVPLVGALQDMGLRVPDDISVVGFDNIDLTETSSPPITTVHIFKECIGEKAIELLSWRLGHLNRPHETAMISTMLLVRASSGPPPK